jgi:AcrR family transcriptional regulator
MVPGASKVDPGLAASEGNGTRHVLLVTAERMFAESGLDGVSLLAIARAAGQGNKNAVQYHFGSKVGLITAILEARAELIGRRRADLSLEAAAAGRLNDVDVLVKAMYLPVVEQVDEDGTCVFARFALQVLNYPGPRAQVLGSSAGTWPDSVTRQLGSLLQKAIPHVSADLMEWRILIQLHTVMTCLVDHENALRRGEHRPPRQQVIEETFNMVAAALGAPAHATAK